MSIAAMAVWIVTAIIGALLLAGGISNEHRQAAEAAAAARQTEPAARQTEPAAGPAGHPLLEFSHPALAVTGLMFWIFYVVSDHSAFAWIAFAMLATTGLLGTGWLISGLERRRRARVPPGPVFPRRLVVLHGVAVACTVTLALLAAVHIG
jgi:hypothetical protein